jgi:hypothetical protein
MGGSRSSVGSSRETVPEEPTPGQIDLALDVPADGP